MERIITPVELMEDGNSELSLRPQKINEYIGQDKVKERLNVFIKAAQSRGGRWWFPFSTRQTVFQTKAASPCG